jgi:hypothetical protein
LRHKFNALSAAWQLQAGSGPQNFEHWVLSNYISRAFPDQGIGSHSGARVLSREQVLPLRQPKNGNKQQEIDVPLAKLVPGGGEEVDGNRENTLRANQVPLGLDFHALLVVFAWDPELLHLLKIAIN